LLKLKKDLKSSYWKNPIKIKLSFNLKNSHINAGEFKH